VSANQVMMKGRNKVTCPSQVSIGGIVER